MEKRNLESEGPCVCGCHEDWWGEQVNNIDVCHIIKE